MELADREREILDFERTWWHDIDAGASEDGQPAKTSKSAVIKHRLALSPSRYYRLLQAVLDNPAAMAYDPLVVRRIRRERLARRRARLEGSWVSTPPRR